MLDNATLKFQPDWPPLQNVDAQVAFIDNGMDVQGRARSTAWACANCTRPSRISGMRGWRSTPRAAVMRRACWRAAREPVVQAAEGHLRRAFGQRARRRRLRARHPVRRTPARADRRNRPPRRVRASDARWKLAFDDLRGSARYDQHGFDAEGLKARHEGQPGLLSLRGAGAGPRTRGRECVRGRTRGEHGRRRADRPGAAVRLAEAPISTAVRNGRSASPCPKRNRRTRRAACSCVRTWSARA